MGELLGRGWGLPQDLHGIGAKLRLRWAGRRIELDWVKFWGGQGLRSHLRVWREQRRRPQTTRI